MKKTAVLFVVLCLTAFQGVAYAQNVKFKKYFEDATLRINYLRVGCRQQDSIRQVQVCGKIPVWAGSMTQLLDPFDNGEYRILVRSLDGCDLYSRCYSSLFKEYRDTPQGADSVAAFEEVLRLPWPKKPVVICWQRRDDHQQFQTQFSYHFDPAGKSDTVAAAEAVARLQYKGDVHKKIDVVIVPEGYGPADSAKMRRDLRSFRDYLLGQEPFLSRRNDFNVWGVVRTGQESGITDPTKHLYVNSLVGSSYNTFGSDRYLMTMQLFRLHDAIGDIPCDHIIIMANSGTYGGGAIYNFYAMSSLNEMAYMVLPHELGHSIGGLADEYVDEDLSYGDIHPLTVEPTEPNITTLVDFSKKWQSMLPQGTPVPSPINSRVPYTENGPLGVFEGAGYHANGIFRPTMHCMMRDYAPFCPVCTQRLNEVFDLYVK